MTSIEKYEILETRIVLHSDKVTYHYFQSDVKVFLEQFFENKKMTVLEMIEEHNDIYAAFSELTTTYAPHKAEGTGIVTAVSQNRKVESWDLSFQGMSYNIEFDNGLTGKFLSTKFNLLCGKFWIDGYPCPIQIGDELEFKFDSLYNHKYKRTFNNFKLNVAKIMKAYRAKERVFKQSLIAA